MSRILVRALEGDAALVQMVADFARGYRQIIEDDPTSEAFVLLARVERNLQAAAAELLVAGEAYTEHRGLRQEAYADIGPCIPIDDSGWTFAPRHRRSDSGFRS